MVFKFFSKLARSTHCFLSILTLILLLKEGDTVIVAGLVTGI